MAEIRFQSGKCLGHALCNATAPEVYELDRAGNLFAPPWMPLDSALEEAARAGARACPARAINIVDNDASEEGAENVIQLHPSLAEAKGINVSGENHRAAPAAVSYLTGLSGEAQAGRR